MSENYLLGRGHIEIRYTSLGKIRGIGKMTIKKLFAEKIYNVEQLLKLEDDYAALHHTLLDQPATKVDIKKLRMVEKRLGWIRQGKVIVAFRSVGNVEPFKV